MGMNQKPIVVRSTYMAGDGPLFVGRNGWLYWRPVPSLDVRLRVAVSQGGGYEPEAISIQKVEKGSAVSGTDLRNIPLGQLERLLRDPELVEALSRSDDLPDFDPATCSPQQAQATAPERAAIERVWHDADLVVSVPRRGQRDSSFYLDVEKLYQNVATTSHRPAAVIAEANQVAVSTVHGWLKKARRMRSDASDQEKPAATPT